MILSQGSVVSISQSHVLVMRCSASTHFRFIWGLPSMPPHTSMDCTITFGRSSTPPTFCVRTHLLFHSESSIAGLTRNSRAVDVVIENEEMRKRETDLSQGKAVVPLVKSHSYSRHPKRGKHGQALTPHLEDKKRHLKEETEIEGREDSLVQSGDGHATSSQQAQSIDLAEAYRYLATPPHIPL